MEHKDVKKKMAWYMRIIILFFIIITARFIYLSLILGPDIVANEIIDNRVRETVNQAERGTITDSNGNILAMSLLAQDIALNPNLIVSDSHKEKLAKLLSENIKTLNYNDVMDIINSDLKYKVVAKKVTPEVAQKIRKSGLGGIQISQSPTRIYPNGALGSSFLGFVNNNGEPGAGVEIKLDNYLGGIDGVTVAEVTPYGEQLPIGTKTTLTPVDGNNVQLTIDIYLQSILEKNLKLAVDELQPEEIHAVLMEPNTGKVLAMTSYPSYDSSDYQKSDSSTWTNTPANFTYEPGSIIKPIVVAGALTQGVIEDDTKLPSGSKWVQGKLIKDWNRGQGWGTLTAKTTLSNSSNVAMMRIGELLGKKGLIDVFEKAGIGSATGIELPGEESGFNFPTVEALKNDPIRNANVTFGQGIVTTPIQMVTAISEIVNGGHEIQPTLIENVTDNDGNIIYQFEESHKERVYTEEAAELVKSYMKYTYQNYSSDYHVEGYEGGAKTGSAWYVDAGSKSYADNKIIGSMVGFLPYDNPQYTLLISVKNPQDVEYGSGAAGPTFKNIMTEVMQYANIEPTKGEADEDLKIDSTKEAISELQIPKLKNYLIGTAKTKIEAAIGNDIDFKIEVNGSGEVVTNQFYSYVDGEFIVTLETVKLVSKNKLNLPILVGEKYSVVENLLDKYNVDYSTYGSGVILSQNLDAGSHKKTSRLILWGE